MTEHRALAIETHQLGKRYTPKRGQPIQALEGLDLTVERGQIFALLGPNGAGKTTTISILTTLVTPSTGWARVAGFDVVTEAAHVRRRIGLTFQETVLDQRMTGRQILEFHGRLYGQDRATRAARIQELAALVEIEEALDRVTAGYSGGMKRRLELARGLMTNPQILFLDEPTQGLDPQNRAGIWRYVRRLQREKGITLLLTTHYMEEAEQLADRVGIIDRGRLALEGTPQELVNRMGADIVALRGSGAVDRFVAALQATPFVERVARHETAGDGGLLQIGVNAGNRRLVQIVQMAAESGYQVQEVSVARPSLADVFLQQTGHTLRD